MKMGQTNMHTYMKPLLERIEKDQIDPTYIISHRITREDAPRMYEVWRDKKENVTKIASVSANANEHTCQSHPQAAMPDARMCVVTGFARGRSSLSDNDLQSGDCKGYSQAHIHLSEVISLLQV